MMPAVGLDTEVCAACVANKGLCTRHESSVLPQLARNIGWLKLMGEAVAEQTRLQTADAEAAAVEKAKRREARKQKRHGMAGLIASIRSAA